jgi:molybdate transport system regulatory protein
MNRQSRAPVVTLNVGGKGGGGARLTAAGERAIDAFWSLWKGLDEFLVAQTRTLEL